MDAHSQKLLDSPHVSRRRGIWKFIFARTSLLLAIFSGLPLIVLTACFTYWLSTQTFFCPTWALDCHIRPSVAYIRTHLPFVQGIVSTFHGIGLALLAYPAFIFAEAAIWPILTHHSYTLASFDMYLSATRGSVPGLLQAIRNVGSGKASTVMICVALVTIISQADRLVIGQVYTFGNVTTTYASKYQGGGGIGMPFTQEYPPGPFPNPVTSASSFFTSWSKNLSSEPLPEIRNFIVDRTTLAQVGNFSVMGLMASKSVNCSGQSLKMNDTKDGLTFSVASKYPSPDSSIRLRLQPRLTVWVDEVQFKSTLRTITTVVFASLNGTIEGGVFNPSTPKMKGTPAGIHGISSLRCDIDVTLKEDLITVGNGPLNTNLNISATQTVTGPGKGKSPFGLLSEVALWMGAIITKLGISVSGTQPMWAHQANALPSVHTTTQGVAPETWPQNELLNFIDVASGALALAMSVQWARAPITLESDVSVPRLVAWRSWMLLAPAALVLLTEVFLAAWLSSTYRRAGVLEIRQAKTCDVIWSTQNQSIREGMEEIRASSKGGEELDIMHVRYDAIPSENAQMGLRWERNDQGSISGIPLGEYCHFSKQRRV